MNVSEVNLASGPKCFFGSCVESIIIIQYSATAQKCTFLPRRRRCNCNTEHCGRGTCSRSVYVAARAEFEPATLWMKGDESTNEPLSPNNIILQCRPNIYNASRSSNLTLRNAIG